MPDVITGRAISIMAEEDITFSIDSFVNSLASYMGPAQDYGVTSSLRGWEIIGQRALARSRRVPVPVFMCVALVH